MYLPAKFEVSSIILTSFRRGYFNPPTHTHTQHTHTHTRQNEPLKSPPGLGLNILLIYDGTISFQYLKSVVAMQGSTLSETWGQLVYLK